jgi:hypothetical protein
MDAVLLELQIQIGVAKPLEHQCSMATISPGFGSNCSRRRK